MQTSKALTFIKKHYKSTQLSSRFQQKFFFYRLNIQRSKNKPNNSLIKINFFSHPSNFWAKSFLLLSKNWKSLTHFRLKQLSFTRKIDKKGFYLKNIRNRNTNLQNFFTEKILQHSTFFLKLASKIKTGQVTPFLNSEVFSNTTQKENTLFLQNLYHLSYLTIKKGDSRTRLKSLFNKFKNSNSKFSLSPTKSFKLKNSSNTNLNSKIHLTRNQVIRNKKNMLKPRLINKKPFFDFIIQKSFIPHSFKTFRTLKISKNYKFFQKNFFTYYFNFPQFTIKRPCINKFKKLSSLLFKKNFEYKGKIKNYFLSHNNKVLKPLYRIGFVQPFFVLNYFQYQDEKFIDKELTSYNLIYSFSNSYKIKQDVVRLLWKNLSSQENLAIELFSEKTKLFLNKNFYIKTNKDLDNNFFKPTSIKFKPGYSRQWRRFRADFQELSDLHFTYQKPLTSFFQKMHWKSWKKKTLLTLPNFLQQTCLTVNNETANILIKKGLIFLNGFSSKNPNIELIYGDFIQLIVSLKYIFFLKWSFKNTFKIQQKFQKLVKQYKKKKYLTLPKWLIKFHSQLFNNPIIFEMDYFTLSAVYLYTQLNLPSKNYNNMTHSLKVLPLYNWKYII